MLDPILTECTQSENMLMSQASKLYPSFHLPHSLFGSGSMVPYQCSIGFLNTDVLLMSVMATQ